MKKRTIIGKVLKLAAVGGAIGAVAYLGKMSNKKDKELFLRYKSYYTTTNQWLQIKLNGKDIGVYFTDNKIKTIAIYGHGSMGELFYEDIKKADVKVSYFIDKNAAEIYYGLDDIPVVAIQGIEEQEPVDAIIVTPVYDFEEIFADLTVINSKAKIISLEDIIYYS